MNPRYDFTGQVALVTGAAKGMGLVTARMFAESGASVVMCDLDGELAAHEAERIVRDGGAAIGLTCDVRRSAGRGDDRSSGRRIWQARHGLNNAGIQVPPSNAAEESIEHFDQVVA